MCQCTTLDNVSEKNWGKKVASKRKGRVKLLYAFFWVIPRRLNFISQSFGTLCLFHLHRRVGTRYVGTYSPMKMEQTECSETLAYKIQSPGNCPEESIQHSEHGENLKLGKGKIVPVHALKEYWEVEI